MNRGIFVIFSILSLLAFGQSLFAQSLLDNPDYKKAIELQQLAKDAHAAGDYDKAYEYSEEARIYIARSNAYIAQKILWYKANSWLNKARSRVAYFKSSEINPDYQQAYQQALAGLEAAEKSFTEDQYENSIEYSKGILTLLAEAKSEALLPKYYKVRLIPEERDCLNKIAGYPFIYNDRTKWRILYEANKSKLKYINNPHLIFPEQVFEIPSIEGEKRSGEYDPKASYPVFGK